MNAITTICLVLGATVIGVAATALILWVGDLDQNGYQVGRKRRG